MTPARKRKGKVVTSSADNVALADAGASGGNVLSSKLRGCGAGSDAAALAVAVAEAAGAAARA